MKSEIWFNCGNRFEISQLKSKFIIPHKVEFKRTSEGINIKLPTKNGEESYLVAGVGLSKWLKYLIGRSRFVSASGNHYIHIRRF